MSAEEERKAFVRRQIDELWNKGNLDFAEEGFTPDFVSHDHMQIVDQVAEGDKVVTRYLTTCTHKGELAGIPPTGRRVEVAGMGIDYFRGGKIAESWEYYDVLGLMQQMGVATIPSPRLLVRVLVHQAKKSFSRVSEACRRK